MIAMAVASTLLLGAGAAYSALGRTAHRLAVTQAGLADRPAPVCRSPEPASTAPKRRSRCELPERCDYDPVSQSCRSTKT